MALSKQQILEADDLPREEVEVPEWGGSIWIRTMTGVERDFFEQSVIGSHLNGNNRQNLTNVRARLVVLTAVDENGIRLFEEKDADELGKKSSAVLDRLFAVAQRLNGLSRDDIEELEKNSLPDRGAVSSRI